jgi:FkbM family methyltransferase
MSLRTLAKSTARSLGFDISRLSSAQIARNQPADDPFLHQQRLLRGQEVAVIFDVGAHKGRVTDKYRTLFPAATIHCFEPCIRTRAILENIAASWTNVHIHGAAVSDKNGTASFMETNEADMNSLLRLSENSRTFAQTITRAPVSVETITLDTFCRTYHLGHINILKLDVQGAELLALRGADQLLRNQSIDLIYTDVNYNEIYESQAFFHDVAAHLYGYNYRLYGIYQVAYSPLGPIGWSDAIFLSTRWFPSGR